MTTEGAPMSEGDPGPLIGSGRAADVFDIGGGRVLRRNRDGSSTEREADVMQYLHAMGYPVPEVYEANGADLVMDRVVGPTMLHAFPRQPWRLRSWARILASLHDRLQVVPLPEIDLPCRIGDSEVLVHGDLHPDNVMLTDDGPIVIDWPNVSVGARGADVASTWIIVATSNIEAGGLTGALQSAGRSLFLRTFLGHSDRDLARSMLPVAAAHRLKDRNLRPGEAAKVHELLSVEGLI
jgi:aminoglycoside phosphotransferase (APT) family kinase protein